MIKKDPLKGEETTRDHNKVETLLLIKYSIRTLKLIIIILNFSYFLGMTWLIICESVLYWTNQFYLFLAADVTHEKYGYFEMKYCHGMHKISEIP